MEEASTAPSYLDLQHSVFDAQMLIESESKASILRVPVKKLAVEEFRAFLSRRLPLVITGLNSSLQLPWSPSQLIAEYGKQSCTMEDCEARCPPLPGSLEEFLSLFSPDSTDESSSPGAIWKVKVCILHTGRTLPHLVQF
jgi:hypothetical protein